MTKGNAKYANMWLEYYNLERSVNPCVMTLCDIIEVKHEYGVLTDCFGVLTGLLETLCTVERLSTEQSSVPQTILSMCVKSCSLLREWRVSHHFKIRSYYEINVEFINHSASVCLTSLGSLEDWDVAVQKTENRLTRINQQRAKVGVHISITLGQCII